MPLVSCSHCHSAKVTLAMWTGNWVSSPALEVDIGLAAAAAKSLQSCPTLCDPIDGSPRGSHPWDSLGKNTGVGCHFLLQCMKVKSESEVSQSCPTLSDPMDCSSPGSSAHGIFQARVLEWGAIAFSGHRTYQPETPGFCEDGRHLVCLFVSCYSTCWGFPGGKEFACQFRRHKRRGFNPWVGKIPWRRKWQPTPVFLSEKFHGQRSLAGYSP